MIKKKICLWLFFCLAAGFLFFSFSPNNSFRNATATLSFIFNNDQASLIKKESGISLIQINKSDQDRQGLFVLEGSIIEEKIFLETIKRNVAQARNEDRVVSKIKEGVDIKEEYDNDPISFINPPNHYLIGPNYHIDPKSVKAEIVDEDNKRREVKIELDSSGRLLKYDENDWSEGGWLLISYDYGSFNKPFKLTVLKDQALQEEVVKEDVVVEEEPVQENTVAEEVTEEDVVSDPVEEEIVEQPIQEEVIEEEEVVDEEIIEEEPIEEEIIAEEVISEPIEESFVSEEEAIAEEVVEEEQPVEGFVEEEVVEVEVALEELIQEEVVEEVIVSDSIEEDPVTEEIIEDEEIIEEQPIQEASIFSTEEDPVTEEIIEDEEIIEEQPIQEASIFSTLSSFNLFKVFFNFFNLFKYTTATNSNLLANIDEALVEKEDLVTEEVIVKEQLVAEPVVEELIEEDVVVEEQTDKLSSSFVFEKIFDIALPILGGGSQTFNVYSDGKVIVHNDNQEQVALYQSPLANYELANVTTSYTTSDNMVQINLSFDTLEGQVINAQYVFGLDNNQQYIRKATFSLENGDLLASINRLPSLPTPDGGLWLTTPNGISLHFSNSGIDQLYNENHAQGAQNFVSSGEVLIDNGEVIGQLEILEDSSNKVRIAAGGTVYTIYFSGKLYVEHQNKNLELNLAGNAPQLAFVKENTSTAFLLDLIDLNPSNQLINQLTQDFNNPDNLDFIIGESNGEFNTTEGYYPMVADTDKVEFWIDGKTTNRFYPVFQIDNWNSKALPNFYAELEGQALQPEIDYIISFKDNQPPTDNQSATLIFQYLGIVTNKVRFYLDPIVTWDGGGGDNNWSTAANWSGDATPGTGDIATFDTTSTANVTIDANIDVGGIDINSGYTGTITQSNSITIIVGSSNYDQADGTFSGGDSSIDINGSYTISAGTFTSTSNTMTVSTNFTESGSPTWTHNSGTVTFDTATVATIDASGVTFNKVVIDKDGTGVTGNTLLTITSGTTLPLGDSPTITLNNTKSGGGEPVGTMDLTNSGTITAGTGTWTITADGTFTNSGTITANSISTFNMTSGTFINNSTASLNSASAFDIDGDYTHNNASATLTCASGCNASFAEDLTVTQAGSAFLSGHGTITFDSPTAATIDASDLTFSKVVIDKSGTGLAGNTLLTISSGTTIPLGDSPTITLNNTKSGGGEAVGLMDLTNSGTITAGTGTLTVTADGTFTNSGTITANSLSTFNMTSGTFTNNSTTSFNGVSTFDIDGDYIHNNASATLTCASDCNASFAEDLTVTQAGSAFLSGHDTITFDSPTAATIDASDLTFSKVVIDKSGRGLGGNTLLTISSGTTLPLGDSPTITLNNTKSGGGEPVGLMDLTNSGTITAGTGTLTVTADGTFTNSGTITTKGGVLTGSITNSTGSTISFLGDGDAASDTFTITNFLTSYENLIINSTDGLSDIFKLGAALTVDDDLTITAGIFDLAGQNLTTSAANTTFSNSATFRLEGGETVSNLTMDTDSGTVEYDGTSTYTSLPGGNSYNILTFNGSGGSWQHASTLDVNGALTITAGTLDSNGQNITLAGNWNNSGTYTSGSNTVTLDGTSQALTGASTFYNLSKIVTSADTLTFPASATTTVTNTATLKGVAGQLLSLRSSSADTQWLFDPQGTRTIEYLDVKDSNNVNATGIITADLNITDSGNLTNWTFNTAPVATVPASISQSTSGNGEITFSTDISDTDNDETKVKVEYSDDGGTTWYDPDLVSVTPSQGATDLDDAQAYQVGSVDGIDTDTALTTLTIVWDSSSTSNGNGAIIDRQTDIKVRVTANDATIDSTIKTSAAFEVDNVDPTGLGGVAADNTNQLTGVDVAVSWSAATDDNLDRYDIWYGKDKTDVNNKTGSATSVNTTGTSKTLTSLDRNVTYYIKVFASDTLGNEQTHTVLEQSTVIPGGAMLIPGPVGGSRLSLIKKTEKPLIKIAKKTPIALRSQWSLVAAPKPLPKLSPVMKRLVNLITKFPHLNKTFKEIGMNKIVDATKLRPVEFNLPRLAEITQLRPEIKLAPLAALRGIPVSKLSTAELAKIPVGVVFVRSADEKIDLNVSFALNKKGQVRQVVNVVAGQSVKLVVKSAMPVESVRGYILTLPENNFDLTNIPPSSLMALTSPQLIKNQVQPVNRYLVLKEFDYRPVGNNVFVADVQVPRGGDRYQIKTIIDYVDPKMPNQEVELVTVIDPEGYVYSKIKDQELRIKGAKVSLFWKNPATKKFELWPADEFQQNNLQITDKTGQYFFLVPEGQYYIMTEAKSYRLYKSDLFMVRRDAGVHINIELERKTFFSRFIDWLNKIFGR